MIGRFSQLSTWIILAILPLFLAGCATRYGAKNVAPTGYSYNNAIAQSKDEQLLLNLVRLRYRDTVVFMDITGVTTQHQYTAGISSETLFPFDELRSGASLMIPNATYSETPTVTYAPIEGVEFAKNLLSPISAETIVLLANSGWSIERLLACCVERLGTLSNAPSVSGPTPPVLPNNAAFRKTASILRQLQRDERVYVEEVSSAARSGKNIYLVVEAAPGLDCDYLRNTLAAPNCQMRFQLIERRGELKDGELLAQTRTVLGALYALSHAVVIPDQHQQAGFATTSEIESSETPDWDTFLGQQFRVQSSIEEPKNAFVKVLYRHHWFWIDDKDLETKTTFSLVSFLLSLQSAASDGVSPLLTLSAG